MRIDRIMSPREASVWWKYNGPWQRGGGTSEWAFKPVHNTPQEIYRLDKRISQEKLVKHARVNNNTITMFEAGKLKRATDVSWIRLASFYGRHILSVKVIHKTDWWAKYERAYAKLTGETRHRRIRMAARIVARKHDRFLKASNKKHEEKIPNHAVQWYKQGTLVHGGIY